MLFFQQEWFDGALTLMAMDWRARIAAERIAMIKMSHCKVLILMVMAIALVMVIVMIRCLMYTLVQPI